MKRLALLVAAGALAAGGCRGESSPEPEASAAGAELPGGAAAKAALPPQASDFPALASKNCVEVAQFYFEAVSSGEFDRAALVWNDPVIDGERLKALFEGYGQPQFAWNEPFVDNSAGTSHCTISGILTDAANPATIAREGTVLLRRANDVPGATPEQLRWTIQSTTFIEPMERSGRGEPA